MTKPRVRVTTKGDVFVRDGFANVAANLGTSRDKAAHSSYSYIPLAAWFALNAYRQSRLAQKIIEIPAEDATRRWRAWQAEGLEISAIEKQEKRLGLQRKLKTARVAARLFGGAALYLSIKGQEEDVSEPLNLESIGKDDLLDVTVLTRSQLIPGPIQSDPLLPGWGEPTHFTINANSGKATVVEIHPSRLCIFRGLAYLTENPLDWRWGDGILQSVLQTLKQHDGLVANVASLVFEANVDVVHIPRLMEMMADDEEEAKVLKYLRSLATIKGNNGMLLLDGGDASEGENDSGGTKYDRKSISFTGLADLWDRFMIAVSAAADIPVTKLFGRSATGLNSTGEGDRKNYHESIASEQANQIQPDIYALDEALIRSTFGTRDESIYYEWRPLDQPSDKERAETGKVVADILTALESLKVLPQETMQAVAVAALTETAALPGLEAAVDEHGLKLEEDEPGLEDQQGALGVRVTTATSEQRRQQMALVQDAAPRSLYVSRKVLNSAELIRWAKAEGFEGIEPADELHVTIAYSRKPVNWMDMGQPWDDEIIVPQGGPRAIEAMGAMADYIALQFRSYSLEHRHEHMIREGATWDWPEYQAHITFARGTVIPKDAKPYQGRIVLGPEIFEEVKED